jgi:AbrB family looped-hinge helix DNA binding protein
MVEISEEELPFIAEVTAGGRITIPEEIRRIFEIRDGDAVLCRVRLVKRKPPQQEPK